MKPLGRNRWTFLFTQGDKLVHNALAMYGTGYEQRDTRVYPTDGITECGVHVKLISGHPGGCYEGFYVDDDQMLTCIRCLSGVSTDGISFRQDWTIKGRTYSVAYLDEVMDLCSPWLAASLAKLP